MVPDITSQVFLEVTCRSSVSCLTLALVLFVGKKASASEDRSLVVHADPSAPDSEICLEFNTAGDREKWFEVLSALLLASSTCPHYLQTL
jgi:hypothetical protein